MMWYNNGKNRDFVVSTHWDIMAVISQMTYSNLYPELKLLCFNSNFAEIYIQGSNYQYASIGSDNDLVPNRRLAIIWLKGG